MTKKEFGRLLSAIISSPPKTEIIYNRAELLATKEIITALKKVRASLIDIKAYHFALWKRYTSKKHNNEELAVEALYQVGEASTGIDAISLHIKNLSSAKREYIAYLVGQLFTSSVLRTHLSGGDRLDLPRQANLADEAMSSNIDSDDEPFSEFKD